MNCWSNVNTTEEQVLITLSWSDNSTCMSGLFIFNCMEHRQTTKCRGLASKPSSDYAQLKGLFSLHQTCCSETSYWRHDLSRDDIRDVHPLERFNKASARTSALLAMTERCALAEKAMSEGYARLRFKDTSLLIWQQLEKAPPTSYLSRSQSSWYSQYGNQAVVVRDKTRLKDSDSTGRSRICAIMWSWYSSRDS